MNKKYIVYLAVILLIALAVYVTNKQSSGTASKIDSIDTTSAEYKTILASWTTERAISYWNHFGNVPDVLDKNDFFKLTGPIESTQKSSSTGLDATQILPNWDWVYPNMNDAQSAWKFTSDGRFNFSTTAFGGMTTTGRWAAGSPGEVALYYDDGMVNNIVIVSQDRFKVGETIYQRY